MQISFFIETNIVDFMEFKNNVSNMEVKQILKRVSYEVYEIYNLLHFTDIMSNLLQSITELNKSKSMTSSILGNFIIYSDDADIDDKFHEFLLHEIQAMIKASDDNSNSAIYPVDLEIPMLLERIKKIFVLSNNRLQFLILNSIENHYINSADKKSKFMKFVEAFKDGSYLERHYPEILKLNTLSNDNQHLINDVRYDDLVVILKILLNYIKDIVTKIDGMMAINITA